MESSYRIDLAQPDASVGYLLRRVNKLGMMRAESEFDGTGTSFTQWLVLVLICGRAATSCSELSRELDHNSGAMTRVIDQLQERGLLTRQPEIADRRVTRLGVTRAGQDIVDELAARLGRLWDRLLVDFTDAEVAQLTGLLARLLARLEAADA